MYCLCRGGGRGGGVIEGAIIPLVCVFKNRFFKTVQITRLISVSPLFLIIFKNMNCLFFFLQCQCFKQFWFFFQAGVFSTVILCLRFVSFKNAVEDSEHLGIYFK